jgi:RNA polymerase sigma factor (sigma-70 family)
VIVDDDALMRAGLQAILSSDPTIELVSEASDGEEAIRETQTHRPDVVLMDIRMPTLDGIAATRELTATAPHTKVVILTTFEDDDYIFGALNAGAAGFLLKRARPEELIEAIHTVAAGDSLLSPVITSRVIARMTQRTSLHDHPQQRLDTLTPREREVFALIGRGLSNNEIAAELVVEESTVKTHVKRILHKLRLRDRVQAVIAAYESGIVGNNPGPAFSRTNPHAS